jgi:hypothetical protein
MFSECRKEVVSLWRVAGQGFGSCVKGGVMSCDDV